MKSPKAQKPTALVTCYFQPNYGSMLQALATQMALDKLGYENETINISGFNREIKSAKMKYFIKASLTSDILVSKAGMAKNVLIKKFKFAHSDYVRKTEQRRKKFLSYCEQQFRLSKRITSKKNLALYTKQNYSAVLVGSDQLWLPGNIAADYYTLSWVPIGINTIAYATSFGQSQLPPDSSKKAVEFLKRIKHIGVREMTGHLL